MKEKMTYPECVKEAVHRSVAEIKRKNHGMLKTFYTADEVVGILLRIPPKAKIIFDEQ